MSSWYHLLLLLA